MNIMLKPAGTGFLFLLAIGTGFWLSSQGKPFHTAVLTVHKLVALASAVAAFIVVRGLFKTVDPSTAVIAMAVITGLLMVALFVSGALLTLDSPVSDIIATIHKVTPTLTLVAVVATIYLIGKSNH